MEPEKPTSKTSAKAGRPRGFCTDTALDRALDVFWRKGYDGTSLTDLTEAMGINRPSLYAAYGNKESLYRRAIERYEEKTCCGLTQAKAQPTARGFIEHLLMMGVVGGTDPSHPPGCFLLQSVGGTCDAGDDPLRRDIAQKRLSMEQAIGERLRRAVDDGELPAGTDVCALAKYFSVVMQGMAVHASGGASAETLRAVVKTAMNAWPENQKR